MRFKATFHCPSASSRTVGGESLAKRSFAPAGIESRSGVVSAEDVYVGEAGSGGLPPTDRLVEERAFSTACTSVGCSRRPLGLGSMSCQALVEIRLRSVNCLI